MNVNYKKKRKGYPPSNVSSHYYTDPVYSSEGFYGFEEGYDDEINQEVENSEDNQALDEPVESWGWINNVENTPFKQ